MTRLTLVAVNKALSDLGAKEVLVKGAGYYYFCEGEADRWPQCSVYVYRLNHLSLKQWIEEWTRLKAQFEAQS